MNQSQKSESNKIQSKILMKHKSLLLPATLIFIAFVLVILAISQTGILNPVSSNESVTVSQEQSVVPAIEPPIPPSPTTTGASTTTMETAPVISTRTPIATLTQTPTGITTTTTTVAPEKQTGVKNILETAGADGRFTIFVAAVNAAGINDMLIGDSPESHEMFTVFAPTDDAFKNLPSGTMDALLKDPQEDLLQILLYHVVQGKVMAVDLRKLQSVETLQGGFLPISVSNSVVTIDGANVIITDIECSNGVIHGIDIVMIPPA
jgi:uncharacterized surface protein with fasciclin (FAS1) repeats